MSPTITNPKHKYTSIYCISPSSTFDYRLYLNNFHSYFIIIRDTSRNYLSFINIFWFPSGFLNFHIELKCMDQVISEKKWWSQLDVTSFWEATSFKINEILHHKSPCCVCGIYRQSKYIYRCQCNVTSILNIWNHWFMRSFLSN